MSCFLISGVVSDLTISEGYEDPLFSTEDKRAIGIASVLAAASGNGLSSSVLATSSHGAIVRLKYFSCTVDGQSLKGRFHEVGFCNGDRIDFVVSTQNGRVEVQAARDPKRRLIWTLPYQTRGNVAQKNSAAKGSIVISSALAFLAPVVTFWNSSFPNDELFVEVLWLAGPLFLFSLIINFLARRPFYSFSLRATEVFRVLGFDDPANVDLPRMHSRAEREYCLKTGEERVWQIVPWRFRYLAA